MILLHAEMVILTDYLLLDVLDYALVDSLR